VALLWGSKVLFAQVDSLPSVDHLRVLG